MAGCRADCRREAPIGARLIAIGVFLGLAGAAMAEAPSRVVSVRLEGAPLPGSAPTLDALLGEPATPDAIAKTLRALEAVPRAGTFDVRLKTRGERTAVRVIHTARARHVGEIAVQVDADHLGLERSRALLRRVNTRQAVFLRDGRRFHPYLLVADRAALTRWYVSRGFRDVQVHAVLVRRIDLVDIGWQITLGDRYVYAAPRLLALPRAIGRGGLRVRAGAVAAARDLAADQRLLEGRLCAAGYPRGRVTAQETVGPRTEDGVRPVTVRFTVDPGPRIVTGAVQVAGRYVPQIILATLPLNEGDPYCPSVEEAARVRLVEFLRDTGVPDPRITAHRRTWLRPDGQRVLAITFDVRRLVAARVERIWFAGNQITSARVLRQLTAIKEGDRYRQTSVDESVQAMRRSGLFRRVAVDVIEGVRADRVSLRFRVIERPPFRVDPVARSVTLYNLDVASWPEDMADVNQGFAFRGGGQRLDLFGETSALGFRWFHGFLGRYLISSVGLRRSTSSKAAFEETWFAGDAGIGLKTATNDLSGLLLGELIWYESARTDGFAIDVLEGTALAGALTLQLSFDFTRRNDERIQYVGLEGRANLRAGTALAGEPIRWVDDFSRIKLHIPLWRTERGQHWVLRVGARNRKVISLGDAPLPGNLRRHPSARGYSSSAIGVEFQGPDDESERLGALHAVDGTLELRIPIPFGRRNGISPFLDAAAAADDTDALLDDVHYAIGAALSFSFFQERIEGVVWGAWPLNSDADSEVVGGGFGGSF